MTTSPIAVVTGGAGFIGSHAVDRLLEEGYRVRVIDNLQGGHLSNLKHHRSNPALSLDTIDIRSVEPNSPLFKEARYVLHFAGIGDIVPSIEKPTAYMDVNVQGTVRILEASRHANVQKFVYAASSSCYGLAQVPTDEKAPIDPRYPYALSKYLGELAAFHWHRVYKLPVNSIRIFNAYGVRSRTTGAYGAVMGVFLKQKLEGKPFTVVGDGTQRRDFIYVTDVADVFYKAATADISGEIYNLGAGNPQSVNRLVELLKGNITHIPKRPGEPDCTFANIGKLQRELHWKPEISFEEGISLMLSSIQDWEDAPLWDPASIANSTKLWFDFLAERGTI